MKRFPIIALLFVLAGCGTLQRDAVETRGQWTPAQANAWYAKQSWLVGCNFIPSTAINQLEMWQAETWDPATIDRELGWAGDIGFTSVRVYLHDIPWTQDRNGFLKRIEQFLSIADKHGIGAVFVLFDGVWDPNPRAGKQREPKPHVHNSGWVQNPGAKILGDPSRHDEMKNYVQDIIGHFRNDRRVHAWDIFNEPNNPVRQYQDVELKNKSEMASLLLQKAYVWAREMNPSQPITSAVWIGTWSDPEKLSHMEKFQLEESDIITFHNYSSIEQMTKCVQSLRRYHRPIVCTEYMARGNNSRFDPILGYLKEQNIGAYNWGFVTGKSQTIYPWDSWDKEYTGEPAVWFHDIFRRDGTPFDVKEVQYIKSLTRDAKTPKTQRRTSAPIAIRGQVVVAQ